ncbi:MAG: enoyl-CoA hydratase-related protein [Proteobacteria bacterium]|nr:enoyl-CoA hydratase-related protein [Pseudomonadota bacterium]
MSAEMILTDIAGNGVGTITINRPEVRNAYNSDLLKALVESVRAFVADDAVRVIILRGNGSHFQAGADIKWIKANAALTPTENRAISELTTRTMKRLNECPKPIVALVQGGCFGGGMGFVASADIAVAEESAEFAITEARWGLVGGPILPQVVAAIGAQQTRRYALTAERFGAARAFEIGLIHSICPKGDLDQAAQPILEMLLKAGPKALQATKALIFDIARIRLGDAAANWIIEQNSRQRQTDEAPEGLNSFIERRDPSWFLETRNGE